MKKTVRQVHKKRCLLFVAAADTRLGLGGVTRNDGMEIVQLLRLERELRVTRLMVDLHRLDVRCGDFAQGALQLGMATFDLSEPVRLSSLPAASVRRRCVDLRRYLLRRVLLRLRLPCHRAFFCVSFWAEEEERGEAI